MRRLGGILPLHGAAIEQGRAFFLCSRAGHPSASTDKFHLGARGHKNGGSSVSQNRLPLPVYQSELLTFPENPKNAYIADIPLNYSLQTVSASHLSQR